MHHEHSFIRLHSLHQGTTARTSSACTNCPSLDCFPDPGFVPPGGNSFGRKERNLDPRNGLMLLPNPISVATD